MGSNQTKNIHLLYEYIPWMCYTVTSVVTGIKYLFIEDCHVKTI